MWKSTSFCLLLSHLPVSFGSPQFLHCEKYSVIFLYSFFCATHDFIDVYALPLFFFFLIWKVITCVAAFLHGHCFIASISLATLFSFFSSAKLFLRWKNRTLCSIQNVSALWMYTVVLWCFLAFNLLFFFFFLQ